jgi:uncharacterized membrane protein
MKTRAVFRASFLAMALALGACSQGSEIASPGATNPGTPPGGGGPGGGGGGGGGTATCPSGTTNAGALGSLTVCNLTGEILANTTLTNVANVVYRLNGRVDIGRDIGASGTLTTGVAATLSIDPGVRLFGQAAGDMLIVNRGSRLNAIGTTNQPVIFTGRGDIEGTANPDTTDRLWGGVVMLGRAPIRGCNTAVAQGSVDCQNAIEGVTAATGRDALYGGAVSADNSGTMRYVQIRYPGAFLTSAAAGDDLNGLSLGGIGSGTTIDHVQIHNSGDDGIEIFGGTVGLKNIAITGALDDSLDTDEGWQGNVQFLVIRQSVTGRTGGPDRIFEWSNRAVSSLTGTLNTNPNVSNVTAIGVPQGSTGANLQGVVMNNTSGTPGGSGQVVNSVFTGSTTCAALSSANTSPAPRFNSVLFDCPTQPDATSLGFINAGANNTTTTANSLSGFLPGPTELARPVFDVSTLGGFFTPVTYIGAFSATETAASNWASGWTFNLFPAAACPTGTTSGGTLNGLNRCVLSGTVTGALRLTAGNIYEISNRVNIGQDQGGNPAAPIAGRVSGTLTIDAGVTLFGDASSDMIVVNRGSQIFANGTAVGPVVMTSLADVTNSQANPLTASREWAGLIVLGRAPIRACNAAVASGSVDCQNAIEGVTAATGADALYGGATAADSSGRLTYLQIKYPGAFLTSAAAGDDLNGLSLGAVGSGTQIDHIQIHNSGDDGTEIFGGTVNIKNLIITGALDDSLDCDEGYTGNIQFGIVVQAITQSGGPDRLIECSNRAVSAIAGSPLNTNPTLANFTFVGVPANFAGAATQGIVFNNTSGTPGGSGRVVNSVVTGSAVCVASSSANTSPAPVFTSVQFNCPNAPDATSLGFINAGTNNTTNVVSTLTGTFINGANENAAIATNPNALNSFFTATTYIGAVQNAADTWWQGWTCGLAAGSTC